MVLWHSAAMCCVLRVACCVLRVACCVLHVACCVLCVARCAAAWLRVSVDCMDAFVIVLRGIVIVYLMCHSGEGFQWHLQ